MSQAEDKLLEVVRQLEVRVEGAVGAVVKSGPKMPFSVGGGAAPISSEVSGTAHIGARSSARESTLTHASAHCGGVSEVRTKYALNKWRCGTDKQRGMRIHMQLREQ